MKHQNSFFQSKEEYLAFKKQWAQLKGKTGADHILYNVLRGLEPSRGFTPITKASKLSNGHAPMQAFANALAKVKSIIENKEVPGWREQLFITWSQMYAQKLISEGCYEFLCKCMNVTPAKPKVVAPAKPQGIISKLFARA
jgi:hypothetical protein